MIQVTPTIGGTMDSGYTAVVSFPEGELTTGDSSYISVTPTTGFTHGTITVGMGTSAVSGTFDLTLGEETKLPLGAMLSAYWTKRSASVAMGTSVAVSIDVKLIPDTVPVSGHTIEEYSNTYSATFVLKKGTIYKGKLLADMVWVFNPNYLTLTGFNGVNKIALTVGSHTIYPSVYNGEAKVDISRLLQLNFTDPQTTRLLDIDIKVGVVTDVFTETALISTTVCAVWGGLNIGDRVANFGYTEYEAEIPWQVCDVQCFYNFPFSIQLLCPADTVIKKREGYGGYSVLETLTDNTLRTYTLGTDFDASLHKVVYRQQPSVGGDEGTFDETFDYTFRYPAEACVITRIHMRSEQEGYYLRWVDHFGYIRYYLFAHGDMEHNIETDENSLVRTAQYGALYFGNLARTRQAKVTRSINVCAMDVDKQSLEYIKDIIGSPFVDMYMGKTKDGEEIWQPITIAPNTLTTKTYHAYHQDVELTINLPQSVTQSI